MVAYASASEIDETLDSEKTRKVTSEKREAKKSKLKLPMEPPVDKFGRIWRIWVTPCLT